MNDKPDFLNLVAVGAQDAALKKTKTCGARPAARKAAAAADTHILDKRAHINTLKELDDHVLKARLASHLQQVHDHAEKDIRRLDSHLGLPFGKVPTKAKAHVASDLRKAGHVSEKDIRRLDSHLGLPSVAWKAKHHAAPKPGGTLAKVRNVASTQACAKLCDQKKDVGCKAFSLDDLGVCHLKAHAKTVPAAGHTTHVKVAGHHAAHAKAAGGGGGGCPHTAEECPHCGGGGGGGGVSPGCNYSWHAHYTPGAQAYHTDKCVSRVINDMGDVDLCTAYMAGIGEGNPDMAACTVEDLGRICRKYEDEFSVQDAVELCQHMNAGATAFWNKYGQKKRAGHQ